MRSLFLLLTSGVSLVPLPALTERQPANSQIATFSENTQQPATLPSGPVKSGAADELPLLPDEISLLPAPPEPQPSLPRYRLRLAQDAIPPLLPPLNFAPSGPARPESSLAVAVSKFTFSGNTVFSPNQLLKVVAKYSGRTISAEELEEARLALTRLYVEAGYLNSGAILPDQDLSGGVIHFKIVEGRLTDIDLSGNRWFRSWWLKMQLRRAAGTPVNFYELRTGLQLLRQNPGVSRINAELKPGSQPGESILHTIVQEESPFHLTFELSNKRPPSVGEFCGEIHFADLNLLGLNDPLDLRWGVANGSKDGNISNPNLDNLSTSYEIPFTPWGTTLGFHACKNDSSVIEEAFAILGIKSSSVEYGISLQQPLLQTLDNTVSVRFAADRKHTETTLLGRPFTLSPGAVDGETDVFVTRLAGEWTTRSQLAVFTVRSTLNLGLYALGASRANPRIDPSSRDAVPDSKFTFWLGQAQYIRRIFDTPANQARPKTYEWNVLRESVLLLRCNAQLSRDALLSMEQFSLGGAQSIRGYRENQILRDNGVLASVELRIPVWMHADKTPVLSLAPFFDYGTGWDTGKTKDSTDTIYSVGVGILMLPSKRVQAALTFGHPLVKRQKTRESIQDLGIHFTISITAF